MPELIPAEPLSPEWHAARNQGVTATDIVTILGLSRWDSAYSLFWRKMGQVPEVPDSDRFRLGRELEPIIAGRWEEAEGRHVWPGGLYRHSQRSWQLATLDRRDVDKPLELKSWADADRRSWDDGPPAAVRAQVLWQMDVMDVAVGHVGVVFLPSGEFRSYVLSHGPHSSEIHGLFAGCEICDDTLLMREQGAEFMRRLRLELPPPDPDSSAASLAAVRARFAKVPDKQAEIDRGLWNDWADHREAAKHFEELARGLEIKLREQAGEASVLTVDGQPVARRVIVDAEVKAHKRHQDYLKRIDPKESSDD